MGANAEPAGIDAAWEALAAGDWHAARTAFGAEAEAHGGGEALFGLGTALWWLGETADAVRCQERAFAAFRHAGDSVQAARTALQLCLTHNASLGNRAAARGWLGRAEAIAADAGIGELAGWLALGAAVLANDSGDRVAAEAQARRARDLARTTSDVDLELCALSELGAALVQTGRLEEGVALLDQAMAGALAGEGGSLDTVVLTCCRTVTSCSRAGEMRHATRWIRAADGFHAKYGSPHLFTTCRLHHGAVLFATGRWAEAETEFRAALEVGRDAEPELHAETLAKLAELRVAQGRLPEAERLLDGMADEPAAAYATGAVLLARGEGAAACASLSRALREAGAESVGGAALLDLLAEAEASSGTISARTLEMGERVAETGRSLGCDALLARAERLLGRGAEDPLGHLERALAAFGRLGMPYEAARTRVLLGRLLVEAGRTAAAAEIRSALARFEELGASRDADAAAALLRELGVRASRSGPRNTGLLTRREREVLALLGEGLSNAAIAERLVISRKTAEHHVARVLAKLGMRRGEATAYAVRHRSGESAEK